MSLFTAIILGIVQGLTEFLPISSSAHVRVVSALAGWDDPGAAFSAVIQIGTELAVILYFSRDIWRIITKWFRSLTDASLRNDPDVRIGWLVIIGSIPIGILGLLFEDAISSVFRSLWLVALMLIGFGVLLGVADAIGKRNRTLTDLSVPHGVAYGFFQALALIPGVSRSGGTITGGLLLGYTREAAARYSFLLAIPAVMISGMYKLKDIGEQAVAWGPTLIATGVSFGVGYLVIAGFLKYIASPKHSFAPFVIYRVVLGIILLLLLATGVIPS